VGKIETVSWVARNDVPEAPLRAAIHADLVPPKALFLPARRCPVNFVKYCWKYRNFGPRGQIQAAPFLGLHYRGNQLGLIH
jgi:hypothetical protein